MATCLILAMVFSSSSFTNPGAGIYQAGWKRRHEGGATSWYRCRKLPGGSGRVCSLLGLPHPEGLFLLVSLPGVAARNFGDRLPFTSHRALKKAATIDNVIHSVKAVARFLA